MKPCSLYNYEHDKPFIIEHVASMRQTILYKGFSIYRGGNEKTTISNNTDLSGVRQSFVKIK